jgi:hypothetical protein
MRRLVKFLPILAMLYATTALSDSADLIQNGSFSDGATGFSSQYGTAQCNNAGNYRVISNPHDCHPSWRGADHTTGSGNMMAVNGAGPGTPGRVVWGQTVPVIPNQPYQFQLYICSLFKGSPANLSIAVNGTEIGTQAAPDTASAWVSFTAIWNSGQATSAVLTIVDIITAYTGNDFGLDDISFSGPTPTRQDTWGVLKIRYR